MGALIALGSLTALSLRPVPLVEQGIEHLIAPARLVAEMAAPVRWLSWDDAVEAAGSVEREKEEVVKEALALLEDERRAARPPTHLVPAGLRMVHAEVVERIRGEEDSLVVRWSENTQLEAGIPVVVGEHYVGRLARVDPDHPGRGRVDLVTGSDFRVGAQLNIPGRGMGELIVGGLLRQREDVEGGLFLAIHNPGPWKQRGGKVRVFEWLGEGRAGEWADGFLLGELVSETIEGGVDLKRVRPERDLASGLYRVVLLAPPGDDGAEEVDLEAPTYDPVCWRGASVLTRCTSARGRDGLRLAISPGTSVEPGSAVAFGPHLLGRVEIAGSLTARVRTLSDPGLVLPLLARVEGQEHPVAIGRVTTEGLAPDGRLKVRWESLVGIGDGEGVAPARLFTGGGVRGVPRGLLVGDATLPRSIGLHELLIQPGIDAADCQWAEVWIGAGGGPR